MDGVHVYMCTCASVYVHMCAPVLCGVFVCVYLVRTHPLRTYTQTHTDTLTLTHTHTPSHTQPKGQRISAAQRGGNI